MISYVLLLAWFDMTRDFRDMGLKLLVRISGRASNKIIFELRQLV